MQGRPTDTNNSDDVRLVLPPATSADIEEVNAIRQALGEPDETRLQVDDFDTPEERALVQRTRPASPNINLDDAADHDDEESDEDARGLMHDVLRMRPPSADTIVEQKSWAQKSLVLLRLYAASVTASNRNGFYPEPWGTMIDMATTGASFESGVILWYLFGSDLHDIHERVKAEGRGGFVKGLAVGLAKIAGASIPSALVGFGLGSLIHYFESEIEQRPWLKIFAYPPIARFVTGPLAIAPYLVTKYLINKMYPPNKMDFNRTPALHPLQVIALYGARAYDSLTLNELFYISTKHFWSDATKFWLIHSSVMLADQLALNVDSMAFATAPNRSDGSMYEVKPPPFLNQKEPPALPAPPRVEILPDDYEEPQQHDNNQPLLLDDGDEFQRPDELGRYNGAMTLFAKSKSDMRCDSVKVALWHAGRTGATLSAGVLMSAATNLWGGLHPEEWSDSLRLLFYGFTILATGYAVERGMQNAHYLPEIGRKISSCCGSLFGRNNGNIDEEHPQVNQPLLDNDGPSI